jgi:hypothetical protein
MGESARQGRCLRCLEPITLGKGPRKFCARCADEVRREKKRALYARARPAARTAACHDCGIKFETTRVGGPRKWCDQCRPRHVTSSLPETRACVRCGSIVPLRKYATNLRYCASCAGEVTRAQDRETKRRKRATNPRTPVKCAVCGGTFEPKPQGAIPKACPDCRKTYYESRRPPSPPMTLDKSRRVHMRQRYGITVEQRQELLDDQAGACLICREPESERVRLQVDHDHACCPGTVTCGKCIRGLICPRCNRALGTLRDAPATFTAMAKYLRAGGSPGSPNTRRRRAVAGGE